MRHHIHVTVIGAAMGATATGALAAGDGWSELDAILIEEIVTDTSYEVRKSFPDSLKDGMRDMQLTGYAVPLTPEGAVRELLLVSDMGLCPFCGSGEHSASLAVTLAEPVDGIEEGARITLKGDMRPVHDPETWQAAVLENAVIVLR